MNPEFRYNVVSTNVDGDKSTARFLNPRSAFSWAERLKNEGTPLTITKKVEEKDVTISLDDLKKEAGICRTSRKKTANASKKR